MFIEGRHPPSFQAPAGRHVKGSGIRPRHGRDNPAPTIDLRGYASHKSQHVVVSNETQYPNELMNQQTKQEGSL